MIYCDYQFGKWIEVALDYLPDEIYERVDNKIGFTVLKSDGFRLARKTKAHDDVIILSPWIFPKEVVSENNKVIKYLIFCVLHEIAHVICDHKPPDEIPRQVNESQESEANTKAFAWYNEYAENHKFLTPLTNDIIVGQHEINQKIMKTFL